MAVPSPTIFWTVSTIRHFAIFQLLDLTLFNSFLISCIIDIPEGSLFIPVLLGKSLMSDLLMLLGKIQRLSSSNSIGITSNLVLFELFVLLVLIRDGSVFFSFTWNAVTGDHQHHERLSFSQLNVHQSFNVFLSEPLFWLFSSLLGLLLLCFFILRGFQ